MTHRVGQHLGGSRIGRVDSLPEPEDQTGFAGEDSPSEGRYSPVIAGRLFIPLGFILLAPSAFAHLVSSGVGPFYDGVAHFFLTPEDLLAVIALALLGGLSGQRAAKWVVIALPIAWLVGVILGGRFLIPETSPLLPAFALLLVGLLVATNPHVPAFLPSVLAVLLGVMHGALNGRAMGSTQTASLAALGIAVALGVVILLSGAFVSTLREGWQRIAVRALGSWLAAIGLLSVAWQLRPV